MPCPKFRAAFPGSTQLRTSSSYQMLCQNAESDNLSTAYGKRLPTQEKKTAQSGITGEKLTQAFTACFLELVFFWACPCARLEGRRLNDEDVSGARRVALSVAAAPFGRIQAPGARLR